MIDCAFYGFCAADAEPRTLSKHASHRGAWSTAGGFQSDPIRSGGDGHCGCH